LPVALVEQGMHSIHQPETTQIVYGPAGASQDRSDRFGAEGFTEVMVHKQHPTSVWVLIQMVRSAGFSWLKSVALHSPLPGLRAQIAEGREIHARRRGPA
jgi:hypothetical protein